MPEQREYSTAILSYQHLISTITQAILVSAIRLRHMRSTHKVQPARCTKAEDFSLPLEVAPVLHDYGILLNAEQSFHRQAKFIPD